MKTHNTIIFTVIISVLFVFPITAYSDSGPYYIHHQEYDIDRPDNVNPCIKYELFLRNDNVMYGKKYGCTWSEKVQREVIGILYLDQGFIIFDTTTSSDYTYIMSFYNFDGFWHKYFLNLAGEIEADVVNPNGGRWTLSPTQ